jgi:hypothetical protein
LNTKVQFIQMLMKRIDEKIYTLKLGQEIEKWKMPDGNDVKYTINSLEDYYNQLKHFVDELLEHGGDLF